MAGRYELRRSIARGGAAELFEAVEELGEGRRRSVAIKRLLPGNDGTRGFRDEARIAGALQHPNIVRVFAFGEVDGRPFQALELVRGADLEFFANRAGPMPAGLALYVAREVCRALVHVHAQGIVHRDVTPENVLISWTGEVKLADFGIALAPQREEETTTGVAKGKLEYMAPEQLRGEVADARADVFALGCILRRLLAGAELEGELAALIRDATRPERAERIATAAELEKRIDALRGSASREALEVWLEALDDTEDLAPPPVHGARDLLDLELVLERHENGIPRFASRAIAAQHTPPTEPEVGARVGEYLVGGLLGRGSSATVFRASHPEHGPAIALKVLHAKLNRVPRVVRRFLREARAMRTVDHPNVIRVIETGEDSDFSYIAMELCEGRSLHKVIKDGPLAPERAREIAVQLANGLAAIHALGIVHRDLKPGNVMITGGDRVKLLDFGIAKNVALSADDTQLTKGGVLGTPAFMAPEQRADPATVSAAADLFALGRVIDEMKAGEAFAPLVRELCADDPRARPSAAAVAARLEAMRATPARAREPDVMKLLRVAMVVLPLAALIGAIAIGASFDQKSESPSKPATPIEPVVRAIAEPRAAPARNEEEPAPPVEEPEPLPTPARAAAKAKPPARDVAELAASVTRTLAAHGLQLDDLEATDAGRAWLARWRSRDPDVTAAELEAIIAAYPIDAKLVLARLEKLSTEIRRRSDALTPAELDALEAKYFALRSALTAEATRARCEELLRDASALERELRSR